MKKSNRCTGIVWRVKSAHPPWCAQAVNNGNGNGNGGPA